jgi:hypothetical protein
MYLVLKPPCSHNDEREVWWSSASAAEMQAIGGSVVGVLAIRCCDIDSQFVLQNNMQSFARDIRKARGTFCRMAHISFREKRHSQYFKPRSLVEDLYQVEDNL